MIYYLAVGFSGVVLAFALILFRGVFFDLTERTTSLLNIMLDGDLSDDDKQSALIRRLGSLIVSLVKMLAALAVIVLVTLAPLYLYSVFSSSYFSQQDYSSFYFYLALSIGSIFPFMAFSRWGPTGDYSDWSKLLHRIILNNPNISKALFQLERKLFLSKSEPEAPQFLIVTGLARAGTTALTTILHESENFYSLSYANMPFLLSPNLWGKLYRPKSEVVKERSHGDKVLFGYNTVEALEEYFWKVFTRNSYITSNQLREHKVDLSVYNNYLCYQKLIKKYALKGSVYLSKNNNFMLRYRSLRNINEDFKVILMFRDPINHAASLLNQHQRYKKLQASDRFVIEYMDWLGHHEFGSEHKRLMFNSSEKPGQFDSDSIEYWVSIWIDYYKNILEFSEDDCLALVDYQDFLQYPGPTLEALRNKLGVNFEIPSLEQFNNPGKSLKVEASVERIATDIYGRLLSNKLKV